MANTSERTSLVERLKTGLEEGIQFAREKLNLRAVEIPDRPPAPRVVRLRQVEGASVWKWDQQDPESTVAKQADKQKQEEELKKLEEAACTPVSVRKEKFNLHATIPYGCTIDDIYRAMVDFTQFLAVVNNALHIRGHERLESMLMAANFSGVVSDFLATAIPKHCSNLAKNEYHNGHPDLLPIGVFPNNSIRYGNKGIEVKASRYGRGWQGHNPERTWLLVFVFECNGPRDKARGFEPIPFRFRTVLLGQLTKKDWIFSGRKGKSRRTITASVTKSGFEKMVKNWIYRDEGVAPEEDLLASQKKG